MTIELNPKNRSLKQIRGKHNVLPNARFDRRGKRRRLAKDYQFLLAQSGPYLHQWIEQEGLHRYRLG